MKVVQNTSRLLKLKQTNWMPWYGHLLLWPTASFLLLMLIMGETSTLTCTRASGQCQLNNELTSKSIKTSIPIDSVSKVDVIATENSGESPDAQLVMITNQGEFNVGLSGSFEERDEAAGKLAWFFEDTQAQFIDVKESNKSTYSVFGLVGLGSILAAFLARKTALVSFDRDTDRCDVQLSRFFGLLKGRREICELPKIQNLELSGSLKVAADRILLHQSSGANFFLTDYASKDPRMELAAINSIKEFLSLSDVQTTAETRDKFSAEQGWTTENSSSEFESNPEGSNSDK
jgi:hypothetical protein